MSSKLDLQIFAAKAVVKLLQADAETDLKITQRVFSTEEVNEILGCAIGWLYSAQVAIERLTDIEPGSIVQRMAESIESGDLETILRLGELNEL